MPTQRVDEVARHYEAFGGVSPITAITFRQAAGLSARLRHIGMNLPVYVGMRNGTPFIDEALAEMSRDGVRRAVGFITAAHRSYPSCGQYKQNVADAGRALVARGGPYVEVVFADDWHSHPGYVEANAAHVTEALGRLPRELADSARVVFTAHSIPVAMADASRYRENLAESVTAVLAKLGRSDGALVFQSRSGRPDEPWLGPDVCDYLRDAHSEGLRAAVLSPLGFVCDHVEVLYDLDRAAREVCSALGLPMERARAANDHPSYLDTMAAVVRVTVERDALHRRLPVVSGTSPAPSPEADTDRATSVTLASRVDRVDIAAIPTE